MNEIATWLNRSLRVHNVKKVELAERLGVTPKTVYNWVNGVHSPKKTRISKIKVILEESGPGPMIFPPIKHWGECSSCSLYSRCKSRVVSGLPCMCEGLTRKDVEWADEFDVLDIIVWWIDSPDPQRLFKQQPMKLSVPS